MSKSDNSHLSCRLKSSSGRNLNFTSFISWINYSNLLGGGGNLSIWISQKSVSVTWDSCFECAFYYFHLQIKYTILTHTPPPPASLRLRVATWYTSDLKNINIYFNNLRSQFHDIWTAYFCLHSYLFKPTSASIRFTFIMSNKRNYAVIMKHNKTGVWYWACH